ncbi:CsbD family protein [Mastigocoleus sp. MO_188.B34]|uniref:CsbD family protein n=1 Tax=Mastigocoleus sp. MO_188.B34 TaxID=3036635 RepID=UPI002635E089|nr:CsbD family protein [Mastigocoleus sp. MO_188.B34]MDJ0694183.1 CsbD family protein [Mastigocoleus sp. MO_188.B34]
MINNSKNENHISIFKKYVLSIFSCLFMLTFVWSGVFTNINSIAANAQGLYVQTSPNFIAFDYNENNLKQKAKGNFDKVLGAGSSDKLEGNVEQAVGNTQQNLGKVTGQSKGLAKQVEGRAKQDIGRTKDAAQDLASDIENKTDNAVDSIRDFFQ